MNANAKAVKTELLRTSADTLREGIVIGYDWPNTQDELDRLNSARWLYQAAAELDRLRGQHLVLMELLAEAAHVIHNLPDEVETQEEADMLNTLKDRIARRSRLERRHNRRNAMERRTNFEASIDKKDALKAAEVAGTVVDSMDVRLALMDRVHKGEITLAQAQAELKKIKSGAKRAGMVTRAQAFSRG